MWGGGSKVENEVQILMVRVRNDCCSWSEILLRFFPFTCKVNSYLFCLKEEKDFYGQMVNESGQKSYCPHSLVTCILTGTLYNQGEKV